MEQASEDVALSVESCRTRGLDWEPFFSEEQRTWPKTKTRNTTASAQPGPAQTRQETTPCSWVAKCNTASIHCNGNDKDHLAEETGGRAGETERPKTSRPPGALVSTRAPSQPRTSRVLSVTPPGPDRPAQTSPRALQGYEAGLTEASLTQSVGWQLNRRP